jgi:MerR family transcriptional regulator, copper efflux regulator
LRELLERFGIGLSELGFAARLRREPDLKGAVDGWFEAAPARPEHVASDDWLRWEQNKHEAVLAASFSDTTIVLESR